MKLPREVVLWRLPGRGIGDNLCLTAVAREIHQTAPDVRVEVVARYPELFEGNPHVHSFSPTMPRIWRRRRLRHRLNRLPLRRRYYYMEYRLTKGGGHIITQMCRRVLGEDYKPTLAVDLFLDNDEVDAVRELLPDRPFMAIQSTGKTSSTTNKQWYPNRFQAVVDAFPHIPFVQLGGADDPPLSRCSDLRGKTGLREAASILKHARLNVGLEGGLTHIAQAVCTRSVVVYGGYTEPEMTGYQDNVNIVNQPHCSPCVPATTCLYNHKCMDRISSDIVIEAVDRELSELVHAGEGAR